MGLFQRIADIMHHKNTEGHNRCIFFLYQLEKTSFLFSNPIINKKPETKKNSAFPCTPKVANDGDISLYKGVKWEFVINIAARTFKKSRLLYLMGILQHK